MADPEFRIERAKSGRATCKKCKGLIGKDTLRIGQSKESSQGHTENKWFHAGCVFVPRRTKALRDTADLDGFDRLTGPEQTQLKGWFAGKDLPSAGGASPMAKALPAAELRAKTEPELRALLKNERVATAASLGKRELVGLVEQMQVPAAVFCRIWSRHQLTVGCDGLMQAEQAEHGVVEAKYQKMTAEKMKAELRLNDMVR